MNISKADIPSKILGGTLLYFVINFPMWGKFDACRNDNGFRLEFYPLGVGNPLVLELFVRDVDELHIVSIVLPSKLYYQDFGKNIIGHLHALAKSFGMRLFIFNMVPSFYERMVARGAIPCENDSVEITDNTDLAYRRPAFKK
jgi:hypothetical protein